MKRWCDECKYFRRHIIGETQHGGRFAVHTCMHPTVIAAQASGSVCVAVLCADARLDERGCGGEGRFFKADAEVVTP